MPGVWDHSRLEAYGLREVVALLIGFWTPRLAAEEAVTVADD